MTHEASAFRPHSLRDVGSVFRIQEQQRVVVLSGDASWQAHGDVVRKAAEPVKELKIKLASKCKATVRDAFIEMEETDKSDG